MSALIDALLSKLNGKDTFVALHTGFGKSAIFGILPFAFDEMKGIEECGGWMFVQSYVPPKTMSLEPIHLFTLVSNQVSRCHQRNYCLSGNRTIYETRVHNRDQDLCNTK